MTNNQQQQNHIPPPQPSRRDGSEPVRAALCALVPGIGAVYNRQYTKAVIHFAVFASLVIIADDVEIFGLAAFVFYIFTIFDAYRSANELAQRPDDQAADDSQLNIPLWGSVLVLMGILFLLDNLGLISLRSAMQFWPLLLIFFGVYLIFSYVQGRRPEETYYRQNGASTRNPSTSPEPEPRATHFTPPADPPERES